MPKLIWFRFIGKRPMIDERIRKLRLAEKNPDHIRVELKEVEWLSACTFILIKTGTTQ